MNLFAYGTLQFPEVLNFLLNETFYSEEVEVPGFDRRALKNEIFPAVIKSELKTVSGCLFVGIPDDKRAVLDEFEEDYYTPELIMVSSKKHGQVEAIIYLLREEFLKLLEDCDWDKKQFEANNLSSYLTLRKKGVVLLEHSSLAVEVSASETLGSDSIFSS